MKKKSVIILLTLAILSSVVAGAASASNTFGISTGSNSAGLPVISTFKYPASKASIMEVTPVAAETEYTEIDLTVKGKHLDSPVPALLMDGATYVPLRALALALGATRIKWADGTAYVSAPGLDITICSEDKYIVANGRYLYVPTGIKTVDGYLMVPVRTLCAAFGASISWDATAYSINIVPGKTPIRSGSLYYDETDLYWLSRIISAESRDQPLEGMIAVGTVVLNRVAASNYPDTIYDVIFDFQFGVQFSPAEDGSVYNDPTEKSIIAAKLVLDGARECENCLYFSAVSDCWASYSRTYVKTIGGHDFYA